jgi:integrase
MKKRQTALTKGLPLHLSVTVSKGITYYRYRNPKADKDIALGKNRAAAIVAANHANSILLTRTDLVRKIVGTTMTLEALCEKWLAVVERNVAGFSKSAISEKKTMMTKVKKWNPHLELAEFSVLRINEFLDWIYEPEENDEGSPSARNKARSQLTAMLQYAIKKGFLEVYRNPCEMTDPISTDVTIKRHTYEGWNKIIDHEECPHWLRCAMNIGLTTLQRRGDILNIPMPSSSDTHITVIQKKTEKNSNAGYIKIEITDALREIINECRDDLVSPFLIHRKPRNRKLAREGETEFTKVTPNYLSTELKRIRDLANPYPEYSDSEQPGFHGGRALGIYLMEKQNKEYPQELAGHANVEMTENYGKGHEEIKWNYGTPTLNVLDRESIEALNPSKTVA